jgi:pimeloyl-ACP methyl ester carboxylesterase
MDPDDPTAADGPASADGGAEDGIGELEVEVGAGVDEEEPAAAAFPGARRPDRRWRVDSCGVGISAVEWGDPADPVLLFAHGGFDFAETLDVFAPLLVEGGWRVVSWDQRGHGDSDHAQLYSWEADLRDAHAVLDDVAPGRAVPFVGHSKGGSMVMHLANALPHRVSALVNLDGLPSRRVMPDVAEQRTRLLRQELSAWLEYRRSTSAGKRRKPGTIAELAERRARMNPRLDPAWLRYLVTVGARRDADGWRWKIDPSLRMGGFGPWRPEWSMARLPGIGVPVLGVLGLELEVMGWGTRPEHVLPYLPPGARFEGLEGVGHFVHIEQPRRVADLVLEFLS